MSQRIRYINERPDTNHLLLSMRTFNAAGIDYRVRISSLSMSYDVFNATTNQVVVSGKANTLGTLKRKAKKSLEELGIVFHAESRALSAESAA